MTNEKITDLTFLKSFATNDDTLNKYLSIYKEVAQNNLNLLNTSLNDKDFKSVPTIAHQLKAQLNYVGAKSLINYCDTVTTDDNQTNIDLINKLITGVKQTLVEL